MAARLPSTARWTCWCATARRWAPSGWSTVQQCLRHRQRRRPFHARLRQQGRQTRSSANSISTAPRGSRSRRSRCSAPTCSSASTRKHPASHGPRRDGAVLKKEGEPLAAQGREMLTTCTPYQVGNVPGAASTARGWSRRRSSTATRCSARAPTPKAARAPAPRCSPAASRTGATTSTRTACGTHLVERRLSSRVDLMDWGLLGY